MLTRVVLKIGCLTTEIIEGDGSEFGSSISIHGKYMLVGFTGAYKGKVLYTFLKKLLETKHLLGGEYQTHILTFALMKCQKLIVVLTFVIN